MAKDSTWYVLMVDDEEDTCRLTKDLLQGQELTDGGDSVLVDTISDFSEALRRIESGRYDILMLDVRHGDRDLPDDQVPSQEEGEIILSRITETRFLPIIFYTGLPDHVRSHQNAPFIQVVTKDDAPENLLDAFKRILTSELTAVNRALVGYVDKIQRDYMWGFVADNWKTITEEADKTSVAYLLARRLASSLSGTSVEQLAKTMDSRFSDAIQTDHVHPMQYYLMPPTHEPAAQSGDIYREGSDDQMEYWVLVTPSCDLVQGKAEWLLMAKCELLTDQPEHQEWMESQSATRTKRLRRVLANNRDGHQQGRHFYLPAAMDVPHLIVDLQNIVALPREGPKLQDLERIATMDSPFAEALTSQFSRFYGRIGTPDLDTEWIVSRLQSRLALQS